MNADDLNKEIQDLTKQRDTAIAIAQRASGAIDFAQGVLQKLLEEQNKEEEKSSKKGTRNGNKT